MNINVKRMLFGDGRKRRPPVLLAVTPPRTGERTMLGVENLLQSIAVPEPFSLEIAGDMDGVTLLARCQDDRVVRGQIAAHYPQARIHEISPDDDPCACRTASRPGGLPCGPTARSTCPCALSGTTTCWTPARTPSSP